MLDNRRRNSLIGLSFGICLLIMGLTTSKLDEKLYIEQSGCNLTVKEQIEVCDFMIENTTGTSDMIEIKAFSQLKDELKKKRYTDAVSTVKYITDLGYSMEEIYQDWLF